MRKLKWKYGKKMFEYEFVRKAWKKFMLWNKFDFVKFQIIWYEFFDYFFPDVAIAPAPPPSPPTHARSHSLTGSPDCATKAVIVLYSRTLWVCVWVLVYIHTNTRTHTHTHTHANMHTRTHTSQDRNYLSHVSNAHVRDACPICGWHLHGHIMALERVDIHVATHFQTSSLCCNCILYGKY